MNHSVIVQQGILSSAKAGEIGNSAAYGVICEEFTISTTQAGDKIAAAQGRPTTNLEAIN